MKLTFFSQPPVVYISRHDIFLATFVKGQPQLTSLVQGEWQQEHLEQALALVKKEQGSKINILVSDDLAYVLYAELTATKKELPVQVSELVAQNIPEKRENLVWDYYLRKLSAGKQGVQVLALVNEFGQQLKSVVNQLEIKINHLEPVSLALARQLKVDQPVVVLYGAEPSLILLVRDHQILFAETVDNLDQVTIDNFYKYVQDKLDLKPALTVVAGQLKVASGPGIEKVDINPWVGITKWKAQKKGIDSLRLAAKLEQAVKVSVQETDPAKGKDSEKEQEMGAEASTAKNKNSVNRTLPLLAVFSLLLLALAYLLWSKGYLSAFFSNESSEPVIPQLEEVTPAPTASPVASDAAVITSPTPSPVDLALYRVQVLNGSGQAGEAGVVEEILLAEGFSDIDLGNADSYDYVSTEVQLAEDTPSQVYAEIERALNSDYVLSLSADRLNSNSEYDVLIIVGSESP